MPVCSAKLGTTVIDELRICYVAEPLLLESLRMAELGERISFNNFSLIRISGQHFQYLFRIVDIENSSVASLYFGRYGDVESNFVWLKIENMVLYDVGKLKTIIENIPFELRLTFNNITTMDLAIDFNKNIVYAIRRLCKDKSVTTIINGKAIKDRKKTIPELFLTYKASLDRIKDPTFYVSQREAINNKAKGIHVCAYNKMNEITNASNKQYITDYYGNPQKLYRLEVHLNYDEIKDYFKKVKLVPDITCVFDSTLLSDMFYYHLASVIRFTKGRQKMQWREIL